MATPTFKLTIGPAGEYYFYKKEILARIGSGKNALAYDFVYLLPVKRAVRYFHEQLVAAAPNGVLAEPPIFTFYDFLLKFYQKLPRAKKIVSQSMRLFLIEESLKSCGENLQFFSANSAKRRGLVSKVDALISELREYGYNSELLIEAADVQGDRRYQDFSLLLAAFELSLGDRLIDEAGAIQHVIERLAAQPNIWKQHFPHVKAIYLNGYGLFSQPMLRFFELLRDKVDIHIKLDYLPEYPQLFSHVDAAFESLKSLAPLVLQNDAPKPWEQKLFSRKSLPEPLDLGKKVLIQPCQSRQQEVAFIASYVKRLHLEQGIPLHDIGITFPSLERYAPLIHEIFPRYGLPETGLPYNLSTGFQLSQSPLIRSFLLLLEVPMLRFEVKKLLQLLGSPFLRPDPERKLSADVVKRIAMELRITHFVGDWQNDLEQLIAFLRQQIAVAIEDDDFDLPKLQAQLTEFETAISPLQELLTKLDELDKKQSVNDFRNHFLGLLEKLGFLGWYKSANPHLSTTEQEKEFRAFNRFIKLLDQFSWIVTNLHGQQPLSLREFHGYLSLLVSQATYNLREWSNFGLQIMPRLEILAVEPRVLIFGGMVEGDFPRPFTKDVFFSDDERDAMGLAATEDLLAQDRYLFYQVLSSGVSQLVFTYPRFQKEAALVPSNFLDVLRDQTTAHWRKHLPSPQLLQNQQDLPEQVAMAMPEGVRKSDQLKLKRWLQLNVGDPEKMEMAQLWAQKVRTEHRKRGGDFTAHEGILTDFPAIVAQLQHTFGEKPFSITRLETFAFCPIKFYLRYVLRLEEEQEVETGMTPLERGEFVHRTLFRFYVELRNQKRDRTPWLGLNLLRKIAEQEFDKMPFSGLLFELEREKYFGSERHAGLWEIFLREEEKQIEASGFFPKYFEVAFGKAGRKAEQDPLLPPIPAIELQKNGESIKLTGKVDRIDLNDDDEALLLDYKTGNISASAMAAAQGIDLQLPVYALLMEQLLATKHPSVAPVMTALYQVKDQQNCQRKPVLADMDANVAIAKNSRAALPNKYILDAHGNQLTFGDILIRTRDYLFDYVGQIRVGSYRHTRFPTDDGCRTYCEFRRMCRKDVRKLLDVASGQERFSESDELDK